VVDNDIFSQTLAVNHRLRATRHLLRGTETARQRLVSGRQSPPVINPVCSEDVGHHAPQVCPIV
jgi:hypothetical protein